jgi:hypothetical protein
MFRTPSRQPSLPTATVATFTGSVGSERYDVNLQASAQDDELPTASLCERTLSKRRRKDFQKKFASIRLCLEEPRPPRRLPLNIPRLPLKLRCPANVVAHNWAVRPAQKALQVLGKMEAQTMRLQLHIYSPAHMVASIRANEIAQEALEVLSATKA